VRAEVGINFRYQSAGGLSMPGLCFGTDVAGRLVPVPFFC